MRRRIELGLLVLAGVVTIGGYILAAVAKTSALPANVAPFVGVVVVLFLAAHLATRRLAPHADATLLALAALLNGFGYVVIARLDHSLAGLQALWTALGVGAYIATLAAVRQARSLDRFRYTFALVGVGLLLLPLVPVVGQNINGARLWVRAGGVSFQPVELAKITLVIFFASFLVERRELLSLGTRRVGWMTVPDVKHFGPVVAVWGLSLVIMTAERDVGFSLLLFALFATMVWVVTSRAAYLAAGAVLFAGGAALAWQLFPHVGDRFRIWVDPWSVASGKGYQTVQGLYAFAAGGVAGTGLALGSPQRIPVVASDFIFAAIGEELGLVGAMAVVVAFLLIVGAGLRIALSAEGSFEKVLATGLTMALGVQAFLIMGGVTRLLPLTGLTLPFVSYGGSSLVANYVLIALLVRISDDSHRRRAAAMTEGRGAMARP